jgi:hypothetical protein
MNVTFRRVLPEECPRCPHAARDAEERTAHLPDEWIDGFDFAASEDVFTHSGGSEQNVFFIEQGKTQLSLYGREQESTIRKLDLIPALPLRAFQRRESR